MKQGIVVFAGAGPGAVDLMSIRCRDAIADADVIVYAGSLVNPEVLSWAKPDCEVHDSASMNLQQILDVLVRGAKAGHKVLRLHTGDPSIYGAIAEQMRLLRKAGVGYEVIPGISSVFAAAAAIKAELTVPGHSQTVILTRRAGRTPVPTGQDITSLAAHKLADDLGYADVGCFGAKNIRTPRLDQLAREGMKLTSFYAQAVCGPSRGALMTGRYPNRIGGGWSTLAEEVTVGEVLKQAGYATGCVGKWDISGRRYVEGQVPNDQGFDFYFGPLGANDRGQVQLMRNRETLRDTEDMGALTKLYTDEAIAFLEQKKDGPFFLYLAHTMVHVKLGASAQFLGQSKAGLFGDAVEELDWNIGRVVDCVKKLGLEKQTIVIFASDNGPWLVKKQMGGSAYPLRNGKGSAWEGGFREPCIVWGPGRIPAGTVSGEMACTLDILPTFAALAGAPLPTGRVLDGRDQSGLLTGKTARSARDTFFYHVQGNLHAVRQGKWKLALPDRKLFYNYAPDESPVTTPQLYDLEMDISEKQDVAGQHPEIVRQLLELAKKAREDVGDIRELPPQNAAGSVRR